MVNFQHGVPQPVHLGLIYTYPQSDQRTAQSIPCILPMQLRAFLLLRSVCVALAIPLLKQYTPMALGPTQLITLPTSSKLTLQHVVHRVCQGTAKRILLCKGYVGPSAHNQCRSINWPLQIILALLVPARLQLKCQILLLKNLLVHT